MHCIGSKVEIKLGKPQKKIFVDSPLRGGRGKGLSTKEKSFLSVFFFYSYKFFCPLSRGWGGRAKGLCGLSTKKRTYRRTNPISIAD